jgi:hypothetical protein
VSATGGAKENKQRTSHILSGSHVPLEQKQHACKSLARGNKPTNTIAGKGSGLHARAALVHQVPIGGTESVENETARQVLTIS